MFFTKVLSAHTAQGLGFLEKQVSNAINLKEPQIQGAEREQSCWELPLSCELEQLCGALQGRESSPGCHRLSGGTALPQGSPGVMSILFLPPPSSWCSCNPQDAGGLPLLEL